MLCWSYQEQNIVSKIADEEVVNIKSENDQFCLSELESGATRLFSGVGGEDEESIQTSNVKQDIGVIKKCFCMQWFMAPIVNCIV